MIYVRQYLGFSDATKRLFLASLTNCNPKWIYRKLHILDWKRWASSGIEIGRYVVCNLLLLQTYFRIAAFMCNIRDICCRCQHHILFRSSS